MGDMYPKVLMVESRRQLLLVLVSSCGPAIRRHLIINSWATLAFMLIGDPFRHTGTEAF